MYTARFFSVGLVSSNRAPRRPILTIKHCIQSIIAQTLPARQEATAAGGTPGEALPRRRDHRLPPQVAGSEEHHHLHRLPAAVGATSWPPLPVPAGAPVADGRGST